MKPPHLTPELIAGAAPVATVEEAETQGNLVAGGHDPLELLQGAFPEYTGNGEYIAEMVNAAKQYFSDMHKIHNIEHHKAASITGADTRTAGWAGHGDLQPGTALFQITRAIHRRATNKSTYGDNGLPLQMKLIEKAREDPEFHKKLSTTALLTLYQMDLETMPDHAVDKRNAELADEQEILNKDEIRAPLATLRSMLPKLQREIAAEVGVEVKNAEIGK